MSAVNLDLALQVTERPATPADEAFMGALFRADRLPEFLAAGLVPAQAEALVADQFRLQTIGYRREFPTAEWRIICRRGTPVGRIIEADLGDHLNIIDFLIAPEHQGQGLGTEVLHRVLARARRRGVPVRLMAFVGSTAQGMYERAGFVVDGVTPDRVSMVWRP